MFILRSGNGHWWPILGEKSSKGSSHTDVCSGSFRGFFAQTRLTINRLCQFKHPMVISKMRIVLATQNQGKIDELTSLLKPLNITVLSPTHFTIPPIKETGLTFLENAIIKARHVSQYSGLPALADDSGLVVPSLNGEPGIYSARYAGENMPMTAHWQKLLTKLADRHLKRDAYFYCCLAFLRHVHDPIPIIAQGVWHGLIAEKPAGEHGFGYDPLFYVPTHQKTAAELTTAEKNAISHRALALKKFIKKYRIS